MKIKLLISLLFSCLTIIQFIGCSGSNQTTSGTGVGNPEKTTVSFFTRSSVNENAKDSFTVSNNEGLTFTIKEAYINALEIHFIYNGGAIDFKGPYKFNAFSGESEPSINFNTLLEVPYTGLDFIVESEKENSGAYSTELYGTFIYNSQVRNFTIKSMIKGNQKDHFDIENGPVELAPYLNNIFKIDLDVELWLKDLQIKDYLDDQTLPLDANGDLVVDSNSDWKAAKEIAKDIKKAIFKSGNLSVTQE